MRLPTSVHGETLAEMDETRLRMIIHELCFTERERLDQSTDQIITAAEFMLRDDNLDSAKFLALVDSATEASPEWHAAMREYASRQP